MLKGCTGILRRSGHVAFTADGQGIISGAKDGTVRLWPTNAAAREKFYEGNWMPIKFSKDGRMLAAINDQSRFVLLNLRTAEPEDSLHIGQDPVQPVGRRSQR